MDESLTLWGILLTLTALGLWLEHRYRWAARVGGSLIILLLAALCANLGVIPQQSAVYDTIYGPVTSLAIVWLLLLVNLQDVRRLGRSALLAFGIAAVGTLMGALLASLLFHSRFGGDTPRLAGSLAASYIGGSLNFVSVGRALNLTDLLFTAATTADNLLTAVWLGFTLTLPSVLARFYPPRSATDALALSPLPTASSLSAPATKTTVVSERRKPAMNCLWIATAYCGIGFGWWCDPPKPPAMCWRLCAMSWVMPSVFGGIVPCPRMLSILPK